MANDISIDPKSNMYSGGKIAHAIPIISMINIKNDQPMDLKNIDHKVGCMKLEFILI